MHLLNSAQITLFYFPGLERRNKIKFVHTEIN